MKQPLYMLGIACALLVAAPLDARAQSPSIQSELLRDWTALKDTMAKIAAAMPEDKSYFLNGVQAGSVVKSYLLTRRGIEVPGESTIQIPEFIDSVIRFASYPKRRIEVLSDLAGHLQGIRALIGAHEAQ